MQIVVLIAVIWKWIMMPIMMVQEGVHIKNDGCHQLRLHVQTLNIKQKGAKQLPLLSYNDSYT